MNLCWEVMTTAALVLALVGGPSADIDFDRDVRPILSDRCFACHGPDEAAREAGLRLDRREDAIDAGALEPGVASSLLLERIRSGEMPPAESKMSVTPEELSILEKWVEQGAEYEAHWSFEKLETPALPELRGDAWSRDPLDTFVLAGLAERGLSPASEADPERWLRRVTFDLTGLPPTPAEVSSFLADAEPGARERVVDRLLASTAHAERMTRDWLDIARYADTYGYQSDVYRAVWPWRDWVMRAYEENLSYDRFVTWQLAGDLLPDATRDQRLATAFNRLHRQTNEGGSVEEEFRAEYVADRVHTFGTAFLGLTLECARCHDHKFDPISQREYYSLSAYFASIDESGLYSHFTSSVPTPALGLPTEGQQAEVERLLEELGAIPAPAEPDAAGPELLEGELPGLVGRYAMDGEGGNELQNMVEGAAAGTLHGANRRVQGHEARGVELTGDDPLTFPSMGHFRRWDRFSMGLWLRVGEPAERYVVFHRSKAWHDSGSRGYQLLLEDGRPSFSLIHFWPGNALRVRATEPVPVGEWVHVAVTYDGSSRAEGARIYVDGRAVELQVVRDSLDRKIVGGAEGHLTIGERFRDRGFRGGAVDDLAVFNRVLAPLEVLLWADPGRRDEHIALADGAALLAVASARQADNTLEARRALGDAVDRITEIMTMEEMEEPRPTFVLDRGLYDQPGEQVYPGTPEALPGMVPGARPDRLGLAEWLFGPARGLVARVAANRLWQTAFGTGLVPSPEDFGTQGGSPIHPELLEYLASELIESGWDQRALLRRLVLSATYRQDSRGEREIEAELFARHPTRRLTAEEVRDAALSVAGLLVDRPGGPPVKPPQPPGLWREVSGQAYSPDGGEGRWRRSIYTIWKRTSPPPSMLVFDAAKRDVCVVERQSTTTPLQALALWNDEQLVEAARGLAERVLREASSADERVRLAFHLTAGREATAGEVEVLLALREDLIGTYTGDPDAAGALASFGVRPPSEDLDAAHVAAWSVLAATLFSHDAFVTLR